jgi:hypothetical protein
MRSCDQCLEEGRLRAIAAEWSLPDMMALARELRDAGHGNVVNYSRKVFIPLTHLCRDVCSFNVDSYSSARLILNQGTARLILQLSSTPSPLYLVRGNCWAGYVTVPSLEAPGNSSAVALLRPV